MAVLKTKLAELFPKCSSVISCNIPVSGLVGTGFLGDNPFYSYRSSFSKKKIIIDAATAWMRICLFLGAFQASEQSQESLPPTALSSSICAQAEGWTGTGEGEESKPNQNRASSSGNSLPNQRAGGGTGRQHPNANEHLRSTAGRQTQARAESCVGCRLLKESAPCCTWKCWLVRENEDLQIRRRCNIVRIVDNCTFFPT